MAIRLQPGQGRGEEKDNASKSNSQNYEGDNVTQNTKTITAIDSASQDSASNKKIKIIIDEPTKEGALDFQDYSRSLANIIRETTPPQFAVGIFGTWGSGKTTLMKMIQQELDDKDKDKILTVWFDAWRYEREKHLAVIPFLRQIRIALENERAKEKKSGKWDKLKEGTERTISAFIQSLELSFSVPGSPVSATLKPEEFANSWKSIGSTRIDGERVQFHEHVTDYLKTALEELERANPGCRIVVFVDDLDRCTPEKALEVLESIKAFFDIEGIVYVIGMDSKSIDHIVEQKYGKHPTNIKGMDYLQKIVQLPFQIPDWKHEDITKSIETIISKELEHSELVNEFLDPARKKLIVKAIEPNPRQVKRFVNNIILAKSVFFSNETDENRSDKKIEIDKLIVVQALNFRSGWNRFLELISADDEMRKAFFGRYYTDFKQGGRLKKELEILKQKSNADTDLPKEIIDIFQELIKQEDGTLRSFLDAGADKILKDIETMEDYRRALEATKLNKEGKELTGKQGPTKRLLIELLRTGKVKDFDDVRQEVDFHPDLSYADLSDADLSKANLSLADLSGARLSGADLSKADLQVADLSYATLTRSKLRSTDLSSADLSHAGLSSADLSGARLSHADLSYAKLFDADLSHADLSDANLSSAYLSGADLSYAKLHNSILIGARSYSDASKYVDADFTDAIIDDENLTEQAAAKAKNVPPAVKTKKELRKKLQERHLFTDIIDEFLSRSSLPD